TAGVSYSPLNYINPPVYVSIVDQIFFRKRRVPLFIFPGFRRGHLIHNSYYNTFYLSSKYVRFFIIACLLMPYFWWNSTQMAYGSTLLRLVGIIVNEVFLPLIDLYHLLYIVYLSVKTIYAGGFKQLLLLDIQHESTIVGCGRFQKRAWNKKIFIFRAA